MPKKVFKDIVFTKLPTKGQLKIILEWLSIDSIVIKLVLDGEYIIKHCYIEEKLENISDSFIDENIDLTSFQSFFESKAFRFLKIAVIKKRTNPIFTCKIYKLQVKEEDKSIACDACLMWLHAKCTGIKITKKIQNSNCTIKRTYL